MPAAAPRQGDEPTLGSLVQRMLERDEGTRDTLFQMASQLGSLGNAVAGTQQELQRLVKLGEEQAEYNRRQIELAERSQQHQRSIDDFLQESRKQNERLDTLAQAISAQRGGHTALMWVVGVAITVGLALGGPLVGVVYTTIQRDITRLENEHERDMAAAAEARRELRDQLQAQHKAGTP